MKKIYLLPLAVLTLSSCTTIEKVENIQKTQNKNYIEVTRKPILNLIDGNIKKAVKNQNNIPNIKKYKVLNELQKARLLQFDGKYKQSEDLYNQVIKFIPKNKKQNAILANKIIKNKNTYNYFNNDTPYYIPDYEMSYLYIYQALNYLKLGNLDKAINILSEISNTKFWQSRENYIASFIDNKYLQSNNISLEKAGVFNNKAIEKMFDHSNLIPNAYNNPMLAYLKALLLEAKINNWNKSIYQKCLNNIKISQKYTIGNKYIKNLAEDYKNALSGMLSLEPMGMGRLVVFYEQGLINSKQATNVTLNLGKLGKNTLTIPYYPANYELFSPVKVKITDFQNHFIANTYTSTLLDSTLFASKSLVEQYPEILNKKIVATSIMLNKNKNNGILGGKLTLNLSNSTNTDLRSWLLLPNDIQLYETSIDSGKYKLQIGNIKQNIKIKQGATTLIWVVAIGKFKKVYYFIV